MQADRGARSPSKRRSFLFAVALCLASFYVITRRVLAPIQGMVEALFSATRGEFVAFEPAAGEPDEIDKLARVSTPFGGTARRSSAAPGAAAPRHGPGAQQTRSSTISRTSLARPQGAAGADPQPLPLLLGQPGQAGSRKREAPLAPRPLYPAHGALVNDLALLLAARPQELAIGPTDLNPVGRDIEMTLEVFLDERGARISVRARLPTITFDKTRVAELFRNLSPTHQYNDAPRRSSRSPTSRRSAARWRDRARPSLRARNGRGIEAQFHRRQSFHLQAPPGQRGQRGRDGRGPHVRQKIVDDTARDLARIRTSTRQRVYFTLEEESR